MPATKAVWLFFRICLERLLGQLIQLCNYFPGEFVPLSLPIYAGTVKRHIVCKSHVAIDTGVKRIERTVFLPCYFNGTKLVPAFKCICWRNTHSQDSHKNQYPSSVCYFGFTEPWYRDKMLIKFCRWNALSFSLVTHTEVMRDHPIHGLVGLFGTITTCRYDIIINFKRSCTSINRHENHSNRCVTWARDLNWIQSPMLQIEERLKVDMPILTCIFFTFNWLTLTSEMHFVKFHPEVASCLLSRGKRKYAPLGMRLLWKYIRNYFLVYHLISHFLLYLQNYKEFESWNFGFAIRKI